MIGSDFPISPKWTAWKSRDCIKDYYNCSSWLLYPRLCQTYWLGRLLPWTSCSYCRCCHWILRLVFRRFWWQIFCYSLGSVSSLFLNPRNDWQLYQHYQCCFWWSRLRSYTALTYEPYEKVWVCRPRCLSENLSSPLCKGFYSLGGGKVLNLFCCCMPSSVPSRRWCCWTPPSIFSLLYLLTEFLQQFLLFVVVFLVVFFTVNLFKGIYPL